MSQNLQTPATPKENLRAARIVFWAIIAGAVIFSIIVFIINKIQGHLMPEAEQYATLFLYIVSIVAAVCLIIAMRTYKKGVAVAKESLIPLQDKLNLYRTTLVRYIALCEGPAIFSIVAFFVTGNYYLFVITAIMIAAMLAKAPTRQRVTNELALDWQQQQELD
jgi:hypothetical protein